MSFLGYRGQWRFILTDPENLDVVRLQDTFTDCDGIEK